MQIIYDNLDICKANINNDFNNVFANLTELYAHLEKQLRTMQDIDITLVLDLLLVIKENNCENDSDLRFENDAPGIDLETLTMMSRYNNTKDADFAIWGFTCIDIDMLQGE